MRRATVILKTGKVENVDFNGTLIDCMNICMKRWGYFPYVDQVSNFSV